MNDSDGVRIDFADGGVHLRASNTEPIARIIAEAPTAARAQELIAMCAKAAGL
jgi:phosphomannomutase